MCTRRSAIGRHAVQALGQGKEARTQRHSALREPGRTPHEKSASNAQSLRTPPGSKATSGGDLPILDVRKAIFLATLAFRFLVPIEVPHAVERFGNRPAARPGHAAIARQSASFSPGNASGSPLGGSATLGLARRRWPWKWHTKEMAPPMTPQSLGSHALPAPAASAGRPSRAFRPPPALPPHPRCDEPQLRAHHVEAQRIGRQTQGSRSPRQGGHDLGAIRLIPRAASERALIPRLPTASLSGGTRMSGPTLHRSHFAVTTRLRPAAFAAYRAVSAEFSQSRSVT